MKLYTDLEQSKKLAKILPLPYESADMHYIVVEDEHQPTYIAGLGNFFGKYVGKLCILCWSLSALLDILPSGKALIHDKENHGYKCICNNIDTDFYDNPVDACVDMILKLKELNLLK